MDVSGENWTVSVHGTGVLFANSKTNEVIDVHTGLVGSDRAFDAWRLETYARSIRSKIIKFEPILIQLLKKYLIHVHPTIPKHYELANT
jgi:hypothetical protein